MSTYAKCKGGRDRNREKQRVLKREKGRRLFIWLKGFDRIAMIVRSRWVRIFYVITCKSDSITAANENCWYLRNSILQIEFFITPTVTFWMHLQLSLLLLLSCHWASSMLLGWVESPGYPHGYLPHTTLNWSRCARKGHVISLQLTHLDLEDSQNCENDAVEVGLQQNQEPSAAPLF